jgi:hypothetical protein
MDTAIYPEIRIKDERVGVAPRVVQMTAFSPTSCVDWPRKIYVGSDEDILSEGNRTACTVYIFRLPSVSMKFINILFVGCSLV